LFNSAYSYQVRIGVLAFQGDFAEHIDVLQKLGVDAVEVRSLEELSHINALILPGGESTVIARFLRETGVGEEITKRVNGSKGKKPLTVFGTCAGAIVLAKEATGKNAPETLGLIDITVDRNAYGTQVDSFETSLSIKGIPKPVPVVFIRAPKITRVGKEVEVLAKQAGIPVLVRQGNVLVATFHSEVRSSKAVHALFLKITTSRLR
jgi:5'-phosphate synthase pdxT subunit